MLVLQYYSNLFCFCKFVPQFICICGMTDKQDLQQQVESLCALSDKEWETFSARLNCREIKKGDYVLHQDRVCDFVAFVQSGAFVYFRSLENGTEYTTDFGFNGEWIGDMYSRLNGVPSFLNIKALEDSAIHILYQKDLDELLVAIPALEKLLRILVEKAFLKMVRQSLHFQIVDAKERYLKLMDESPEILQRVPLYHIANYLGIAPKSLSRIRKNTVKGR